MATPRGSGTLPPATPSTSQASGTLSQTQSSKSLTFKYSARRSAACVSMSATNTDRQTAQATRVYGRNAVSHLHYLEKKIKLINSKADTFRPELDSAYSRLCCKIDTCAEILNCRVATLRRKGIRGDELDYKLQLLNARKNLYTEDLKRRTDLLNDKKLSYYGDLLRHLELLMSNLGQFAEQLDMHIQPMQSKIDSYIQAVDEKTTNLHVRYDSYLSAFSKEFRDVDILKCNPAKPRLIPRVCNIPLWENI